MASKILWWNIKKRGYVYLKKWKYLEEENNQSAKPNYSPEEIEIAKSLNSEREEKKWTDGDMFNCFVNSKKKLDGGFHNEYLFDNFQQYLKYQILQKFLKNLMFLLLLLLILLIIVIDLKKFSSLSL